MARKKFAKAAAKAQTPPAPKEPAAPVQPSQLKVTLGAAVFTLPLPANNAWAGIEKELKAFLAGKPGSVLEIRYTSSALRGEIAMTHSRQGGSGYTPEECLKFVRAFAYKEMLELYGEKPPKAAGKGKKATKAADPDEVPSIDL
jgi:hypothetical protein